jgi:hypothetical protein
MNMARPAANPARHSPPKHRILRSVPDLDEAPDSPLTENFILREPQVPAEVMSATLIENRRHDETIRRLEQQCDDLQGRLLVLRGQTNALTEENIVLRADLYNLMQAVEATL